MNKPQIQVDKALAPLTHMIDGELIANAMRWNHAEREGIVVDRLGHGDITSWATATSKPFGTVFKPLRPEVGRVPLVFRKVRSLGAVKPFTAQAQVATPTPVFYIPSQGDMMESRMKANQAVVARFEKLGKEFGWDKRTGCAGKATQTKRKERKTFKPRIVGLDVVRKSKVEKMPDWEKEKRERSELTELWLLLKWLVEATS